MFAAWYAKNVAAHELHSSRFAFISSYNSGVRYFVAVLWNFKVYNSLRRLSIAMNHDSRLASNYFYFKLLRSDKGLFRNPSASKLLKRS